MPSVSVTCPRCGNVQLHDTRGTQNGAVQVACSRCNKSFIIELRNGQLAGVRKD
jgi:hypothetical protein